MRGFQCLHYLPLHLGASFETLQRRHLPFEEAPGGHLADNAVGRIVRCSLDNAHEGAVADWQAGRLALSAAARLGSSYNWPRAGSPTLVAPPHEVSIGPFSWQAYARPASREPKAPVQCSGRRWFTDGVLTHVRTPGGPTGPAQPLLRHDRPPPPPCLCPSLTQSNRRGT